MKHRVRVLFWELTTKCNLACCHCRAEAGITGDNFELSTSQLLDMAEDIRQVDDPIIILTGGEPLLRDDIFTVINKCTDLFSRVALASNGICIDEFIAQKLASSGIMRVSISLDGADAFTHDSFRGQDGSFERAVNGCRNLVKQDLSLQINCTVTRHNVDQLQDMVEHALLLEADAFHLFVLVPVGCGVEIPDSVRLDADEIEACLKRLAHISERYAKKLHIKATCAPQYYRIVQEEEMKYESPNLQNRSKGMSPVTSGCLAGTSVCFISHKGDVQPCGYLPLVAGNLFENSFRDIWAESVLFDRLRKTSQLEGSCKSCKYNERCRGCRARAYALTGDYMSADPDCILNKITASEGL